MISPDVSILIVEDDEGAVFGYESYLSDFGAAVKSAATLREAGILVEAGSFDVILLDLNLPDGNALDWIPVQKKQYPHIPIIVISGMGDIPTAVQATRNGAENFLTKPVEMDELRGSIDKCIELSVLRKRNVQLQRLSKNEEPCFGKSPKMTEALAYARVASENESVVLLQGETGTGKGVLAKWIHQNSRRHADAFVELNCSALRGDLLKSELYGHVKGAFTSALRDREGLIEVADAGTLFLDEVGDMDPEVQAQLLKTIEEKSFRRIGENRVRRSNFRLICATNRNLLDATKTGAFRSDLYYRICVFPITIPPLCERTEDIEGLATHILEGFGYRHLPLDASITTMLKQYPFPGNVRELRNMLERAVLLSRDLPLTTVHFPGIDTCPADTGDETQQDNLYEMEKRHILKVLAKYNGDKRLASDALGMSFSNLYRRLQQYRLADL